MFVFKREGTKVTLTVTGEYPIHSWAFPFERQFADEAYAELFRINVNDGMNDKLCDIRNAAYNAGWKDAKAKVTKKTWFSRLW